MGLALLTEKEDWGRARLRTRVRATLEPRAHIPAQLWGIAGSRQRRGWEAEPRAAACWGPGAQGHGGLPETLRWARGEACPSQNPRALVPSWVGFRGGGLGSGKLTPPGESCSVEAAGDRTGRPFASYRLRWGFLESEPIFKQKSLVSINASVKHLRQVSLRRALGGPGVAWAPHISGPSPPWGALQRCGVWGSRKPS